jgi:hypothetical protein
LAGLPAARSHITQETPLSTVWRACLITVFFLLVVLVLVRPSAAHDWYERFPCCSGIDCRKLNIGEVTVTPEGYVVKEAGAKQSRLIKFSDKKIRQITADAPPEAHSYFHICTAGGMLDGGLLCFYVPEGGA